MVLPLNRILFFLFFVAVFEQHGQVNRNIYAPPDYKNKKQFEHFQKRRKIVSQWQIHQLKEGALVVKLKTNIALINELKKAGQNELAESKRLEAFFINQNIREAFQDNFTFCKLYFIYSSASDSLLNGYRKGIFLGPDMAVDSTLEMKEQFYLIAEKDFVYNSSIGFVDEDTARYVRERGNASGEMAEAVLKNKYGHQLKKPFPYICGYGNRVYTFDLAFVKTVPQFYFEEENKINYTIDKTQLMDVKNHPNREFKKAPAGAKVFSLEKNNAYEVVASKVSRLNEELFNFYKGSPKPELDKIENDILPFLY
jgi:hypothetical protein